MVARNLSTLSAKVRVAFWLLVGESASGHQTCKVGDALLVASGVASAIAKVGGGITVNSMVASVVAATDWAAAGPQATHINKTKTVITGNTRRMKSELRMCKITAAL